jgi:hypothetical protein
MARADRTIGLSAATFAAAVLAFPAAAQVTPGSQQWLGLMGADIPPLLKTVQAEPYRAPAEPACDSIPQEILALDQLLGPDVDGEQVKTGKVHMAMNYARGMIPYRGYVRFLTRADSKDKALQRAVTAGVARRAFLRGLEAHMQCAPSATDTKVADSADTKLVDISDKVADVQVANVHPAFRSPPAASPGDEIARQMLTPVGTVPVAARPAEDPPRSRPATPPAAYRLVDSVSGRPIVPDEPTPDDDRAPGGH